MKTSNKFFQYLLRSPELYAITLIKICKMFDDGNFAEGKCEWLKLFPGRFNLAQSVKLDLWGNKKDLFVSRLNSALGTSFTSTCPSPHCLSGVKQISSRAITVHVNGLVFNWAICMSLSISWVHWFNCITCSHIPFYTVIVYV